MARNQVIYNGNVLIDLTPTTATEEKVRNGYVFFRADGTQATGSMMSCPLEPIEYDYNIGYISGGSWVYENPTRTYTDIYEVVSGHRYFITLGANVGTRFRSMFTTTDIRTVTSGTVVGTQIINVNNPAAYRNASYTATDDGYILVAKDNVGKTGVFSYVYDMTGGWI